MLFLFWLGSGHDHGETTGGGLRKREVGMCGIILRPERHRMRHVGSGSIKPSGTRRKQLLSCGRRPQGPQAPKVFYIDETGGQLLGGDRRRASRGQPNEDDLTKLCSNRPSPVTRLLVVEADEAVQSPPYPASDGSLSVCKAMHQSRDVQLMLTVRCRACKHGWRSSATVPLSQP